MRARTYMCSINVSTGATACASLDCAILFFRGKKYRARARERSRARRAGRVSRRSGKINTKIDARPLIKVAQLRLFRGTTLNSSNFVAVEARRSSRRRARFHKVAENTAAARILVEKSQKRGEKRRMQRERVIIEPLPRPQSSLRGLSRALRFAREPREKRIRFETDARIFPSRAFNSKCRCLICLARQRRDIPERSV